LIAARLRTHHLLLLALTAAASLLLAFSTSARAVDFEWDGVAATGVNPGYIASDRAGRVYVPVRSGGRVAVYDKALNGNRPLVNLGVGMLQDPVAVGVDVRDNIYVADAATNLILTFSPFSTGAAFQGVYGAPGTALGQFSGLQQLATDREPRVYAAEAGNGRVQALDPSAGKFNNLFAFGVTDPGPWGSISGITTDNGGRFFVSSDGASDPLRLYASNGVFAGVIANAGSAFGQVKSARGLEVDPIGRLLVADTGNNRVSLFNSAAAGYGAVGVFGSAGSGVGKFDAPSSVATAPGAIVYVADNGNGRIVRLKYDDADHDNALDGADNCQGLSNPGQSDIDGDGAGDDCDGDMDGDGFANGSDACPQVRPYTDKNKDGCQDPFSKVTSPTAKKSVSAAAGLSVRGTARAGTMGVASVTVALARRSGSSCSWYSSAKKRFVRGNCKRPQYTAASGTTKWRLSVRADALKKGRYTVVSRARQKRSGVREGASKRVVSFKITR
jgi:hypothetical protein